MKILFLITRADTVGGAQVHVRDLSHTLIRSGHQVLVVTGEKGPYNDSLADLSIPYIALPQLQQSISPQRDWQTYRSLINILRNFQPDLVSTHSSKAGVLGRLACKATKTPCLFTAHGWAFTNGVPEPKRTLYQWIEKSVEPLADRIICVSDHDRKIGLNCGMSPSRLVTVHNGMPEVQIDSNASISSHSRVKVIMIARFDRQKDHQSLLTAFQDLKDAELDLIGDGPGLQAAQAFVTANRMGDRVNFLGFQTDIAQYLSQAHIFTLISHWEGFPRTIIEAMRAGLPVIASKVGGVSEAVTDSVTGYCIPQGDVHMLRIRLANLIKDANLRLQMGKNGRLKYERAFTFDQMFTATFKVYEAILNQHMSLAVSKSVSSSTPNV